MQGQDTQSGNVISLFDNKNKAAKANGEEAMKGQEGDESFDSIMKQNEKNKERLAKERATANKSVLRSYRIKN